MRRLLLALPLLLAAAARFGAGRRRLLQGQEGAPVVGIGVGSGYDINARLLARHLSKHIPGNPDHHRAEPAGRRLADDDQPALRRGAVRRHRVRRVVQRPADHAAAAADRRALRGDEAQLGRQHQPRNPGDVCLAHGADHDARRSHEQGDDRRRAGAGLDAIRLSDARRKSCSAGRSRSSPATRRRRRSISPWSAARCTAPGRTGRR